MRRIDMRRPPSMASLRLFMQVAYNRSFSETGRLANLSQPALSRTIRLLEEQLGTRLFDRDSRNVRLTQAGEMLLPIVERLTADFDHAFSDLALTFAGQRGRVVIGALPSVAGGVLPEAIASFKASHPQVEIVVRDHLSGTLQREMLERQIDLAITTETNATDIAFHPLFEEQLVLLLLPGSSLDQPGPSNWKIFADHPFIAMAPRSSVRQLTDAAFLKAGIEVPALYECGQFSTVAAMIGADLGISAVPRSIVDMLPGTNLAWRPLHGPRVATMIGVAWPQARTLVPAAEAFRQHLIASVKRSDPGDVRLPKVP
ncbi:LysR family transcriptional regulator [Sphingomonas sp. Xoc002]|uniref:LysR family transcriptional regulator n=1 Tax=Sphingomonas sp. Xoc002 TaxID=2837624 RepID=UPI003D185F00